MLSRSVNRRVVRLSVDVNVNNGSIVGKLVFNSVGLFFLFIFIRAPVAVR